MAERTTSHAPLDRMVTLRVATETRSRWTCLAQAAVCRSTTRPDAGAGLLRAPGGTHCRGVNRQQWSGELERLRRLLDIERGQGIRFSLMTGFYGGGASGAVAAAYLENDADHKAKPRTGVDVLRCAPGLVVAGLVSSVFRPYQALGSLR